MQTDERPPPNASPSILKRAWISTVRDVREAADFYRALFCIVRDYRRSGRSWYAGEEYLARCRILIDGYFRGEAPLPELVQKSLKVGSRDWWANHPPANE
ncbi:hypothetical protein F183_A55270 (plasmid) [Bryobacterales bacterium F-183]|nr:hypothetical protein F183_A55270 [Bryobacterales bacterium F-183]